MPLRPPRPHLAELGVDGHGRGDGAAIAATGPHPACPDPHRPDCPERGRCRHRRVRPGDQPESPASCATSTPNATSSPPSSRLAWRPTLLAGPDLDARARGQDRHQDPHHRRRRLGFPDRRAPGRLRRPCPGHPPLRVLDQGRDPLPARQPCPEVGAVPLRVRSRCPTRPAAPTTTAKGPKKKHNAALICLARRRVDVIYAMLRDHQPYQPTAIAEPEESPARLDKIIETPPSTLHPRRTADPPHHESHPTKSPLHYTALRRNNEAATRQHDTRPR